jgi:5-methylthioribose kinase
MDLGLFLAHLTLKAVRAPQHRAQFTQLMGAFWHGYGDEVSFRPHAELERRGVRHLGACLLARIDGTSPVDYLAEESKRECVRRLGRACLLDGVDRWEAIWDLCNATT